jgi:hypothetical protein
VEGREEAVVRILAPGVEVEEGTRRGVRDDRCRPCHEGAWLLRGGCIEVGEPGGEVNVADCT